jgi:hypothetical protein
MKSQNTENQVDRQVSHPRSHPAVSSTENENNQPMKPGFPYFHLFVVCTILGTAALFWAGGMFSTSPNDTDISLRPSHIQNSFSSQQIENQDSMDDNSKVEENVLVSQPVDSNLPGVGPERVAPVEEDPATMMFGVVSRIRESRENQ